MRFSKRGSMQLGVEAIIILIIAIVLLGSIIYFIRTFMGDTSGNIGEILEAEQGCGKSVVASASNPVVPTTYEAKQGSITKEDMCLYNNYQRTIDSARVHFLSCLKPDLTLVEGSANIPLQIAANPAKIERGKTYSWPVRINAQGLQEADIGTWICQIQISEASSEIDPTANPGIGPIDITFEVA